MTDAENPFDAAYRESSGYFGKAPERILAEHVDLIDRVRPALDVGAGQGRNAVFLAEKGITVHAIDPSVEAVKATADLARWRGLTIHAVRADFESFDPGAAVPGGEADFDSYGAICLFGLVQLLERDRIALLRSRVDSWSGPETVVLLTAFTTRDPSFETCSQSWRALGKYSFVKDDGSLRTFLEPGEAKALFGGYEVVHEWEGMGPEHRHGNGPPQRHGLVELVVRR